MKKVKNRILAEGEVTGHKHQLDNTEVLEREDGVRIFDVEKEDIVRHEEHGKIKLKPKKYASDKVIEFDHFVEEARKVLD